MYRYPNGRRPIKKLPSWTMAILLLAYYIAAGTIIYRTAQENFAAAQAWPQRYEGESWMVWVAAACVAVLVVWGYVRSLLNRIRALEDNARRMRRLQAK